MNGARRFVSGYGFSRIETGDFSGRLKPLQRRKAISWGGSYGTPQGVP